MIVKKKLYKWISKFKPDVKFRYINKKTSLDKNIYNVLSNVKILRNKCCKVEVELISGVDYAIRNDNNSRIFFLFCKNDNEIYIFDKEFEFI